MKQQEKLKVEKMEAMYDRFKVTFDAFKESLEDFNLHYEEYCQLREFYGSDEWFHLVEQPTESIKAGVLSQDQLYDLMSEHHELLADLLELSTKMYKNL